MTINELRDKLIKIGWKHPEFKKLRALLKRRVRWNSRETDGTLEDLDEGGVFYSEEE